MKKRQKKLILLVSVIVAAVLLLTLVYIFVLKPALNGLAIQQQNNGINQGMALTIAYLIQQAASCPADGVPVYAGNITLHMVALECSQRVPEIKLS